jgi:hypothetical protein
MLMHVGPRIKWLTIFLGMHGEHARGEGEEQDSHDADVGIDWTYHDSAN